MAFIESGTHLQVMWQVVGIAVLLATNTLKSQVERVIPVFTLATFQNMYDMIQDAILTCAQKPT